jgi:hypothetical protein
MTDKPSNVEDGANPKAPTPEPKLKFPPHWNVVTKPGTAFAIIGGVRPPKPTDKDAPPADGKPGAS